MRGVVPNPPFFFSLNFTAHWKLDESLESLKMSGRNILCACKLRLLGRVDDAVDNRQLGQERRRFSMSGIAVKRPK